MRTSLCFLLLALATQSAQAELSKAEKIFVKRGLLVHALCFPDHILHPQTLTDCGFTGVTWPGASNLKQLGPPPGMPWCKWIGEDEQLNDDEKAYESNLVALQLRDEQNLNDEKILALGKKWFDDNRKTHPNVILYTNQYGGLLTDANMQRYIQTCKPDMLSFDTYPIWETQDNWRSYFGDLQRYRNFSNAAGIPFACWMQTFHGENKYRDPSESELRLDVFGAWAWGAKMQTCFTYNAGSSALFKKTFNGSGDSTLQPAYGWLKKILSESHNLSPYLSKVKCVDARWVLGKGSEYPWGVAPWKFDADHPELRGITVKNCGKIHDGASSDVAVSFFEPLEPNGNQRWIMVTNVLADPSASAGECAQKITLNFVLSEGQTLHVVNRATGKLEPAKLDKVGEAGRCLLELELPGGTGDLLLLDQRLGG